MLERFEFGLTEFLPTAAIVAQFGSVAESWNAIRRSDFVSAGGEFRASATAAGARPPRAAAVASVALLLACATLLAIAAPTQAQALTAEFEDVPTHHDGSTAFGVKLRFSAPITASPQSLLNHALSATGGTVEQVDRIDNDSAYWEFRVRPSGLAEVAISLPASGPCEEAHAICTADGQALSQGISETVHVLSVTRISQVSILAASSNSGTEGSAAVFTLTRTDVLDETLTVDVRVTESGAMLSGTAPSSVTFAAGSATTELSVATADDEVDEPASAITAKVKYVSFRGYIPAEGAESAVVTVHDDDAAPVITSPGLLSADENGTAVATLAATDNDTAVSDLAWSLAGGADAAKFTLSAAGVLEFDAAKDFEAPDDADQDGDYEIDVQVTDGANPVSAALTVRLVDVGETSKRTDVSVSAGGSTTTRSITPQSGSVTEGTAAVFTLTRTGSLADALTVDVSVSESDEMLSGTPPTSVTFAAGSATAELSAATEDDEVAETASVVTATVSSGTGYTVDGSADSASVTVEDDDAAPVITSTGPLPADENGTAVATLAATDDDTAVSDLAWSLDGGADAAKFTLSTSGVLAFKAAKDFEAPDDADQDGDYEIDVRVSDGANPVDGSLTVRLADVDEVAPALSSASVIADTLTLTFSEFLDGNSVPDASAFTVTVAGTARSVDTVAHSPLDAVTLTLATAASAGETVTVSYTAPTGSNASPLQDLAGNPVAGFSDSAVTNDTGAVARVGLWQRESEWSESSWVIGADVMRTGDTSTALTVNVSVTETGSMLDGTPPVSVTIPAGSSGVGFGSLIKDDMIDEPDSEVTITVLPGTGYQPSETSWDGTSVTVTVLDNDEPPVITTESPVLVPETQVAITELGANARWVLGTMDPAQQLQQVLSGNRPLIWWSLVGGADEDKFTLTAQGELAFKAAKDFEAPDDADADGDYEIEVQADDGYNTTDASLTVRLTDVGSIASGQPSISGTTAQVGQVLTATKGTIVDDDGVPATFAYQWVRVDGSSESDIAGATSSSYTLSAADVGKQVKVKASFTDDDGNAEGPLASDAWPSMGSVVAAQRACPSDADWCATMTLSAVVRERSGDYSATFSYSSADGRGSLSDDTVSHRGVDYTVTAIYRSLSSNLWGGSSYQADHITIRVSGDELPDDTEFTVAGETFTVGAGSDQPRLEESWDVNGLSLPVWSDGQRVTVALKFPANSPPSGNPTISGTVDGTPEVGETLTASADGIADDDGLTNATFAWQWIANDGTSDTDIAGATGSTYTLTPAEVGKRIKVRVTFTDDQGAEATLVSVATATVLTANAAPSGLPTISGEARVGETLTASADGVADGNGLTNATFAWRWFREDRVGAWNAIGTGGETYTLTAAEEGKRVRVRLTFTDDEGHAERLDSEATATVLTANAAPTGLPTILGTARVGATLWAEVSGIVDADGLTNAMFALQWIANDGTADADIAGATTDNYTLTSAEEGKTIKVRVTFTDDGGTEETLVSAATATVEVVGNAAPTGRPTISGTAQVGETLTASVEGIADADGLAGATYVWQWIKYNGTVDTDIRGATVSTYTLTAAEAGMAIKVAVTFTDGGGTEETLVSAATAPVNMAPTGLPTISGTAQVGETLRADASGIVDADGLTNAMFAWQWIANDGTADADISGATAENYTLTSVEAGKTIRVRAAFTDDGGTVETLVSEATAAVGPAALTARFESVPASHDGSGVFTFELHFSEEFEIHFDTLRDEAFEVSGGTVKRARRRQSGSNIGWTITVKPDTDGDVVIELPARSCGETGAVCAADGRALAEAVSATVPGPASVAQVSVSAGGSTSTRNITPQSGSVTEGTAGVFTLTRTGSLADALTVDVSVSESGEMLSGTPPTSVTFSAGSATSELSVATKDDEVAETASVVRAMVSSGTGYTVDGSADSATVTVEDDDAAPVITSTGPLPADENGTAVATLAATDGDTAVSDLAWSLAGGADAAKFTLSAAGVLAFKAAKDFEAPDDADTDGDYEIDVQVTDGANPVEASLTVRLADVDEIVPTLTGSSVDGAGLVLTFSEALDGGSTPDAAAFVVAVDGTARGVSNVAMSASTVTLTLASAVAAGETVTVGYTVPTGANARPLQDVAGNAVAAFAGEAVTNDTPSGNTAPTGVPTISGTARVGETLTADASGIADADGLTGATFAWQWIASDGTSDVDIAGATASTYTLTAAEEGRAVKVRATFTDDGGTEETLASAATAAVRPAPLTARFDNVPESHDGSSHFTFELHFSEELAISYLTLRDESFEVTGGTVKRARRQQRGSNIGWTITVQPDTDGDVAIELPARACGETGAVCSADGRALAEAVSATVPGPASVARVSVSAGDSTRNVTPQSDSVTEGTAAVFTLTRTGSLADALTVDVSVTETDAMLDGTPPSKVTFAANSATAELFVATEDDEVAEAASVVTATVSSGNGYTVDADADSATVTVEDDDAAPVVTTASPIVTPENLTAVATLAATDDDTAVADLAWSLDGGADAAKFTLSAAGVLEFDTAKDFEAPDDADGDGDYEITVRVTDGANPVAAALTVRLFDVDEVAPVLSSASVDDDVLTLTFSEALDGGSTPEPGAFAVAVAGTARGVSNVAMNASAVTLTLASAVAAGEAVTVGYTVPIGANARPLQDFSGNAVAAFAGEAVANDTPAGNAAPTGRPTISGTAQVGETLTADASGIADDDGLPTTFAYQWVRVADGSESDISGATSSSYTLSAADVGKQVKVKLSFTDNDGNAEGPLASDAWPSTGSVVAAQRACPDDADWCATMTLSAFVREGSGFYDATFSYSATDQRGSLSDDTVSHRGVDYTVTAINRSLFSASGLGSSYRYDELGISVSGNALPDGTVFTVAGETLTVGPGSAQPNLEESWDVTGLSLPAWFEGQKVTVALKFPANSPPSGLPTISGTVDGTPEVGETLTASADGIADDDGLTNATFAWQWIANDGNADTDIAGATGSTYTLTLAEEGKTIKVRVTFTDDQGIEATLVSAATGTVSPGGLPTISGTARVGETLTASADSVADEDGLTNATFAWQWIANDGNADTDIAGATGSTYTLTLAEEGKTIKVRVTFTDDGGTEETRTSAATAMVDVGNSAPTGVPTITGTPEVGETLTASADGIADADGLTNATFSWRWSRKEGQVWYAIAGAFGETYTLTAAEAGKAVRVRVTFRDDRGNAQHLYSAPVPLGNNAPTGVPSIGGLPIVGSILQARSSNIRDADGIEGATLAWQWIVNDGSSDSDIAGATADRYTLTSAELGKTIKVRLTYTDNGGTEETLISEPTEAVIPAGALYVNITGPSGVGESLIASISGGPSVHNAREDQFAYQWISSDGTNDVDIAGATENDYTPTAADVGKALKVRVTLTHNDETEETYVSAPTAAIKPAVTLVLEDVPAGHDGMTKFEIKLRFSDHVYVRGVTNRLRFIGSNPPDWGVEAHDPKGTREGDTAKDFTVWITPRHPDEIEFHFDVSRGSCYPMQDICTEDARRLRYANAPRATIPGPLAGHPTISGTPRVGETLYASSSDITDPDGLTGATFAWQWIANDGNADTDIAGATSASYTLTSAEEGKTIKVRVTFTDDGGTEETLVSAATATVEAGNAAPTGRPTISGTAQVGETLTADASGIADADGLTNATFSWQWIKYNGTVDADIGGATASTYMLTAAEAGSAIKVLVTFTDDAGNEEALLSEATAVVNTPPTGLPTISGTAQDGETLTADASGIADADGLTGATFTWQWIVNDGNADTDIAGATGSAYALTAAEAGQTMKVRVTFTDDAGTVETLVSTATAAVEAALPVVSIAASPSQVTEGSDAVFTLSRTGDTASALTVSVAVAEAGSVLSGAPPATATFAAGDADATLAVATADDDAAEADGRVTATLSAGSGYAVSPEAASAGVDVYDNDEAATGTATETLWTSTLTVYDLSGIITGLMEGLPGDLSPDGWSEDGKQFRAEELYYYSGFSELVFDVSTPPPDSGQLTLHVDDMQLRLSDVEGTYRFTWTVADPGWVDGQTVAVKLVREDPDAAVPAGPGLAVADAQVQEAEGAELAFRVTLDAAQTSAVSVRYATSDGTAHAGADYVAASGALRFEAGETFKTVSVSVLNDGHDEGSETMTLTLSHPFGAELSDGTATGTIVNTDAMPRAWLARFGRTVAERHVAAVRDRLGADRSPGFTGRFAGQPLPGTSARHEVRAEGTETGRGTNPPGAIRSASLAPPQEGAVLAFRTPAVPELAEDESLAFRTLLADGDEGQDGRETRNLAVDDVLQGTSFAMMRDAGNGVSHGFWGQADRSGFSGRDGETVLDGEVTSVMLGADWKRKDLLLGLIVSENRGTGTYDGESSGGMIDARLAGLVPFAGREIGEGLSLWGAAGIGRGEMTLTPDGENPINAGIDWTMAAAGAEGALAPGERFGGADLGWHADALWTRMASDVATGLAATSGETVRLRLGLKAAWSRTLASGATLGPRIEAGLRQDGGDAETGHGLEIGGGIGFSDPARGLSISLDGRTLALHEDGAFESWGLGLSLSWDPRPETRRGWSATAGHSLGTSSGGVDALLGPAAFPGLPGAGSEKDWSLEVAHGAGRGHGMTGSAYGRASGSEGVGGLRLGYRIEPDAVHAADASVDWWIGTKSDAGPGAGAGLEWRW